MSAAGEGSTEPIFYFHSLKGNENVNESVLLRNHFTPTKPAQAQPHLISINILFIIKKRKKALDFSKILAIIKKFCSAEFAT